MNVKTKGLHSRIEFDKIKGLESKEDYIGLRLEVNKLVENITGNLLIEKVPIHKLDKAKNFYLEFSIINQAKPQLANRLEVMLNAFFKNKTGLKQINSMEYYIVSDNVHYKDYDKTIFD